MEDREQIELNLMTEFDNVFYSDGKGHLTKAPDVSEPYEWPTYYGDDEVTDEELFADIVSQGWTPLKGFSGQWGYNGPVMHVSEFIGVGCGMHCYILETEGYYVCVPVEALEKDPDTGEWEPGSMAAGWALLYREEK